MSDSRDGAVDALARAGRAFNIGRWADALEAYEEVLSLDDKSVEARAQAGRCRLRLGRGSEAADDLEAAIAVAENPEVAWWVELGDAYIQNGDEDRAAANFQAALERDPNRAEAFAGMGLLYIRTEPTRWPRPPWSGLWSSSRSSQASPAPETTWLSFTATLVITNGRPMNWMPQATWAFRSILPSARSWSNRLLVNAKPTRRSRYDREDRERALNRGVP